MGSWYKTSVWESIFPDNMGVPELKHGLAQLEDGREIVGSNAGEMLEAILSQRRRSNAVLSADTRNMVNRFKHVMKRIPHPSQEGVTEIAMETIGSRALTEPDWMYRVTDMIINTTDVYKDLKASVQDNMPKESQNAEIIQQVYDILLDDVHDYEEELLTYSGRVLADFDQKLGITDELRQQDFEPDFEDQSKIHETVTNVLRQYVGHLQTERYAGAKGEVQQERQTRLALHFRELTAHDLMLEAHARADKEQSFSFHDVFQRLRTRSQHELDQLSRSIGVPSGTFEKDSVSWIALGKYAPTAKAWKSAVHQLVSGERSSVFDILKGWGPEAAAYVASEGGDASKKKRKPKKRSKKKKSSQADTEADSVISESVVSGVTTQTETEDTIAEEGIDEETPSAVSSSGKTGRTSKQKPRGNRLNKFQQNMRAAKANLTTQASTAKASTTDHGIGEDWETIRRSMQAEFKSLKSRLADDAEKGRQYLRTLIADNATTFELKSRLTDASNIRGRRAGHRAPYVTSRRSEYSRRAPVIVRPGKVTPSTPSAAFDASQVSWPTLGGAVETVSGEVRASAESVEADPQETEDDQLSKALSALNLDDFSTAGIDPQLVELVTSFVPSVEEKFQRTLSVPEVVGVMGGWDNIKAVWADIE